MHVDALAEGDEDHAALDDVEHIEPHERRDDAQAEVHLYVGDEDEEDDVHMHAVWIMGVHACMPACW